MPIDLDRFLLAQAPAYAQALAELRAGRKRTHWMWFVLPQLAGLGTSAMSAHYAIGSLEEARAYHAHPVLGARLRECVAVITEHPSRTVADILGEVDALKFHSCITLFLEAAPHDAVLRLALDRCCAGHADARTLGLLGRNSSAGDPTV